METSTNIAQVNDNKDRDPFNTAVAAELKRLVIDDETGMMRLARKTGIPRSTLNRYLDGQRDIRVAELRKIADALNVPVGDVLTQAARSLEQ